MRSVVFAYSDVGYVCLDLLLAQGAEIAAVFTHADDPEERVWFRSVRGLAEQHTLPVFTPERLDGDDWLARLRAWAPDFIFSFYYRRMLPTPVLQTPRLGAMNLHGSLLPKYRGRCPVNWVLINDEKETGVTLHHMVARADAGDIVAQRRVAIALPAVLDAIAGELDIFPRRRRVVRGEARPLAALAQRLQPFGAQPVGKRRIRPAVEVGVDLAFGRGVEPEGYLPVHDVRCEDVVRELRRQRVQPGAVAALERRPRGEKIPVVLPDGRNGEGNS